MKNKVLFSILLVLIFILSAIIFGFLISDANDCRIFYNQVKNDTLLNEQIREDLLADYLKSTIKYSTLCALSGIILCASLTMLVLVLKSDIGFIKDSFLEWRASNKIKREEKQAQEQAARKTQRIAELEKKLNELKKDGE